MMITVRIHAPTVCANACSNSSTNEGSSTSSSGCGSAPITGTVDVYIVGSAEQSATEAAAQEGINTLEDLASITGLVDEAKQSLIDLINQNNPIPENLRGIMATMIENLEDTVGLIKNKFLDLILSGMNVQWICQQLSNAATALPWGIGAVIAQAIAMACPVLLNNVLSELGFYKEKLKTGESIQIIPVPTLKYYQWEVGIPGFIKQARELNSNKS